MSNSQDNKRLAKNTILLYFRTLLIMFVSLYTSRVVLNTLGVDDYGIYQVVGGVVAMFSVISGALSNSISRFITFAIGKGNIEELNRTFCTSVNIQIVIGLLVLLLCELIGVWFLNYKMNIPVERLYAANWVLQCSLVTFIIGLVSMPYNACIIAHEHMSAFALVSILEAILKLIIVYMLCISPYDKLMTYTVLLVLVSIIVRIVYGIYCGKHFIECKYHFVYDRKIFSQMLSFAGWNFFSNAVYIFNTQGISMLVNLYFGVALNAARGIATQVDTAVMQFVNNFTTSINPQITRSYAIQDKSRLDNLICKGAKFSFFLLMLFCIPIICETDYILKLWLKTVPDYTSIFVKLSLVASLITCLGTTGYIACMATGKIKRYVLWITFTGSLAFFITWIVFKLGGNVVSMYIVYIAVYIVVQIVRLYIMKGLLKFSSKLWVKEVFCRIIFPFIITLSFSYLITVWFPSSFLRFAGTTFVCFLSWASSVFAMGLTKGERTLVTSKILNFIKK